MPLDDYQRKRNRARTPEPMPDTPVPGTEQADGEQPNDAGHAATDEQAAHAAMFVVQEHHARRLHYDFRLERDGVLVSWAVPKGVPEDPAVNHLAVHTEDHPLAYAWFSGEIPKGEYGAGTVTIWDRGTYDTVKWTDREVKVVLHGRRLTGGYTVFRTRGNDWMMHRERQPLPGVLTPMLARSEAELPPDDGRWALEMKWDGVRALAYCDGGRIRLMSRTGQDVTPTSPSSRAWCLPSAGPRPRSSG